MSLRTLLALACTLGIAGSAVAQQIRTYTETQTGPTFLAYGLPVPRPIESLTPVDGFRSYASVEARLQGLALGSADLSAHDVGRTFNGRTVWAYVASDSDAIDVEGRPEAAFFINATTHAREWGAPEVSTGTVERLVAGAQDGGFTRYLLDNTRLVIIPVHNIDGLLQAQRFPTDVIVGQDPNFPNDWPRDGRMRRKNMRGVDEVLTTFGDHLGGVDLNRNHPPFWATSTSSSTNPNSLTFHGSGPHSEPENQALLIAATLGPATRFRLGIDVHSFSRVFFSTNLGRVRLNAIQTGLIDRLRNHHLQLSGKNYTDVRDPANRGIGAAAEYFGYEWLVPSWTLELEPQNDATEYGGTNVTHSGFILPASQARRVRESWAETHAVAFYRMAGPPHLSRLRLYDVQSNALVLETRWQFDQQTARRNRVTPLGGILQPGRRYRAELGFSKPMRYRDANGNIAALPGITGIESTPRVALVRDATSVALDATAGTWIGDAGRVLRYRDDSFAFDFTAPIDIAEYRFEVSANDMTGLALDADPATPADWSNGAWSEWEDSTGVDGDVGGADRSASLRVATAAVALVEIVPDSRVVGEGDTVQLRLRRAQPGPERVEIRLTPLNGDFLPPPVVATWLPGESGERSVPLIFADDIEMQGDRDVGATLQEFVNGTGSAPTTVAYRLLDNDSVDALTVRLRDPNAFSGWWSQLRSGANPRRLVLDGDKTYAVPVNAGGSPPNGLPSVLSDLRLDGNGATLDIAAHRVESPAFDVAAAGRLTLDRMQLVAHAAQTSPLPAVLRNAGALTLTRTDVRSDGALGADLIESSGALQIERSLIRVRTNQQAPLKVTGGSAQVAASTIGESEGFPVVQLAAGGLKLHSASWLLNSSGATLFVRAGASSGPEFGHALIQDNTLSTNLSPPILENCDSSALSIGYNIENHTRCGFSAAGDRSGLDLGDFAFNPNLGGFAPIGAAVDGGATAAQASATGCGLVDQRGAPRPQTLTAGTQPLCDIGAIELGVNPYRGIWQPDRNGHGVELHTAGNQLLLVWYTYADDGQPTSYQAVAPLTGPHWEADLLLPRRDSQTGVVTTPRVGRVTIDFASDSDARIGWRFDARGTTGSERIQPAVFANGDPRFEVTGVWFPPAEAGYGATITRRGETTAIVLYYYDAQGNIRWVLGAGNAADALDLEMSSYTGFCPDCNAATMPVTGRPAGRLLAHFHTPARARIDTQIVYPGPAGGSWNRERVRAVPINDPVDNRLVAGKASQ